MKANNYHINHSLSFISHSLLSHALLSKINLEERNQTKIYYFRQNQTKFAFSDIFSSRAFVLVLVSSMELNNKRYVPILSLN